MTPTNTVIDPLGDDTVAARRRHWKILLIARRHARARNEPFCPRSLRLVA